MPFRFPFHLPVLFYNDHFIQVNMFKSCWPIHFEIISPTFQKGLIRCVNSKRNAWALLLSLSKYMQTFYAIWKQRNQLPNNSIDFVAFQKRIIKVMYLHTIFFLEIIPTHCTLTLQLSMLCNLEGAMIKVWVVGEFWLQAEHSSCRQNNNHGKFADMSLNGFLINSKNVLC